jgi:hypothetical protein
MMLTSEFIVILSYNRNSVKDFAKNAIMIAQESALAVAPCWYKVKSSFTKSYSIRGSQLIHVVLL